MWRVLPPNQKSGQGEGEDVTGSFNYISLSVEESITVKGAVFRQLDAEVLS